jgi:hypothetical protein
VSGFDFFILSLKFEKGQAEINRYWQNFCMVLAKFCFVLLSECIRTSSLQWAL